MDASTYFINNNATAAQAAFYFFTNIVAAAYTYNIEASTITFTFTSDDNYSVINNYRNFKKTSGLEASITKNGNTHTVTVEVA